MDGTLTTQAAALLAVFDERRPIQQDGSFSQDAVKETALAMAEIAVEDKESLAALKEWMESHEFWTSPASTRFHGNVRGGLAAHSLLVAAQALRLAPALERSFALSKRAEKFTLAAEDIFIAALAHDFCKAGTYAMESRRTKDFNGNWKYEPFYKTKSDSRNLGHGNESVLLLLESMPSLLKRRNVIEAISRHMGFSDLSQMESCNYSNFLQNPLVILIQLADQTAAGWWDL